MIKLRTSRKSRVVPWNKGKLVGQKHPLKKKEIWNIRYLLEKKHKYRNLAMFNLAIDSKLRSCDLVRLKVSDVMQVASVKERAMLIQQKTGKPVRFEIMPDTRDALTIWIRRANLGPADFLFPSKIDRRTHISRRQYARLVKSWASLANLNPENYGTHSMRRTKPTLMYEKTKNLRAIQILLGHSRMESTVRYLGVEQDDALDLSEKTET